MTENKPKRKPGRPKRVRVPDPGTTLQQDHAHPVDAALANCNVTRAPSDANAVAAREPSAAPLVRASDLPLAKPHGGKREGAGRGRGGANARSRVLQDLIDSKFPGYDPVIAMIELSQDDTVSVPDRISCLKEVAQYLYPKRRAVESEGRGVVELVFTPMDSALK